MTRSRPFLFVASLATGAAIAGLIALPSGDGAQAAGARGPVVVELFTSQGCNSCPPADAFLGKIAARPGVIALSYHVDYWNYLGWRDPYSSKAATKRQKAYRWAMHTSMIYTPQMVVDGRYEGVGSQRTRIERLIAKARAKVEMATVVLSRTGDMLKATVGAVSGTGHCDIWLVFFDKSRTTKIRSGELGGKTLTYHNVVRDFRVVGMYEGKEASLTLPAKDSSGVRRWGAAVLIQKPNGGAIVGAGMITGK